MRQAGQNAFFHSGLEGLDVGFGATVANLRVLWITPLKTLLIDYDVEKKVLSKTKDNAATTLTFSVDKGLAHFHFRSGELFCMSANAAQTLPVQFLFGIDDYTPSPLRVSACKFIV